MHRGAAGCALWVLAGCGINPLFDPTLSASSGATEAGSNSAQDSSSGATGDGLVRPTDFRAAWATPNQIRWAWTSQGDVDDFLAYEVIVGASEEAVLAADATARVWTQDDNPELGELSIPRTFVAHAVEATTTFDHAPDTQYFAVLRAFDTAGGATQTSVATVRTDPEPVYDMVILAEADTPGTSAPASYAISTEAPYAGEAHFSYTHSCGGEAECWENLQRQGMAFDLAEIRGGDFETTAFVEVAIALDNSIPSWWGAIDLWFGPTSDTNRRSYNAWQLPATGEYRLIQAPLRVLTNPDVDGEPPAAFEDLALGLTGFVVGGHWSDGATVRVDEARLRW